MTMTQVKAIARVQITMEFEVSAWGATCAISQIYDQAKEEAMTKARGLMIAGNKVRIIGEPKVIAVLTEESA